jgi:hypothetical protein
VGSEIAIAPDRGISRAASSGETGEVERRWNCYEFWKIRKKSHGKVTTVGTVGER